MCTFWALDMFDVIFFNHKLGALVYLRHCTVFSLANKIYVMLAYFASISLHKEKKKKLSILGD